MAKGSHTLVVGHRGAAGLRPENSLASFAHALDLGVDAVELDVQLSADQVPVVYHDLTLNPDITRTQSGRWVPKAHRRPIKEFTLAELKTYDVGRLRRFSVYARRFPEQVAVDGEKIPTLKEVLDLFSEKAGPQVELWIEIKTSPEQPDLSSRPEAVADAVAALLKDSAYSRPVKILSFDWRALQRIQAIAPALKTVYDTVIPTAAHARSSKNDKWQLWTAGAKMGDDEGALPKAVAAAGGSVWAPRYDQLTSGVVREAHTCGLEVTPWTVDRPDDIKSCIVMKVDGIISNRPDRVKRILTD